MPVPALSRRRSVRTGFSIFTNLIYITASDSIIVPLKIGKIIEDAQPEMKECLFVIPKRL